MKDYPSCIEKCKTKEECVAFALGPNSASPTQTEQDTRRPCVLYAEGKNGPYVKGSGALDWKCFIMPIGMILNVINVRYISYENIYYTYNLKLSNNYIKYTIIEVRKDYECDVGQSRGWYDEQTSNNYPGREVGEMLYHEEETQIDQIQCRSWCDNLNAGAYNWKNNWRVPENLRKTHSCRCYSRKAADSLLEGGLDQSGDGEYWLFCKKEGKCHWRLNVNIEYCLSLFDFLTYFNFPHVRISIIEGRVPNS